MRGSRKFCQRGSNFDNVFFCCFYFNEGRKDPNKTFNWLSTAASEMPFKWRFAGGPMIVKH